MQLYYIRAYLLKQSQFVNYFYNGLICANDFQRSNVKQYHTCIYQVYFCCVWRI